MKLTQDVYMIGGGQAGYGLSGILDCHVYLLDGGSELAIVDVGLGLENDFDQILDNVRADGFDPKNIRKILLTHYHCDHIGAAQEAQQKLDAEVLASTISAPVLREANEKAVALDVAKAIGFYPNDFVLKPCRIDTELAEGDIVQVGSLSLQTIDTPGHCDGHISFHMTGGERNYLLGADLVFNGGTILLQNIHDCRIPEYAQSVDKVMDFDFDALLPGHFQVSLRYGKVQVEKAQAAFRQLGVPRNAL